MFKAVNAKCLRRWAPRATWALAPREPLGPGPRGTLGPGHVFRARFSGRFFGQVFLKNRAGFSSRFLRFGKCQKCVTVVKNRAGTFFGHVFAIRKVPKVCNCRQKSSGHVFRARFQARFFQNCSHFGWVRRFSLLLTLCARRHEKRTHQA